MEKVTCEYALVISLKCFDSPIVLSDYPAALGIYSSFKAGAKYIVVPNIDENCTGYINTDKITAMQFCRQCDSTTVVDDTCVMDDDNSSDDNGGNNPNSTV